MYYRMLPLEHSAILSTFIKLPFSFKTFVLSIFKRLLKTGFTVYIYLALLLKKSQLIGKVMQNISPTPCPHYQLGAIPPKLKIPHWYRHQIKHTGWGILTFSLPIKWRKSIVANLFIYQTNYEISRNARSSGKIGSGVS